MPDLHISFRAVRLATQEYAADDSSILAMLDCAAPIIVAAELRRLADELYDGPQRWPASKVQLLRARADELDPPGGNR